jgi:hypothetical protein
MIAALAAAALLAGWTQVGTGPDGGTSRSGSTLRHLQLFGGLGAWDGYFTPLRDGPLAHATRAQLAAHDPAAPSEPAAASPSRASSDGCTCGTSSGCCRRPTAVISGARPSPPRCSSPYMPFVLEGFVERAPVRDTVWRAGAVDRACTPQRRL